MCQPNQQCTLNKLRTELQCRNFVNEHQLSMQVGAKRAKMWHAMCVYIPTELPFLHTAVGGWVSSHLLTFLSSECIFTVIVVWWACSIVAVGTGCICYLVVVARNRFFFSCWLGNGTRHVLPCTVLYTHTHTAR